MKRFTHDELVDYGQRWLKINRRCGVVISEARHKRVPEIPDIIGWMKDGRSCMVECKVTRADFVSDQFKEHRGIDTTGMYRYYLVPRNLVKKEEVPTGWGLLYADGRGVSQIKRPTKQILSVGGENREKLLMYAEMRKFHMLHDGDVLRPSRNGKRVTKMFMLKEEIDKMYEPLINSNQIEIDFSKK